MNASASSASSASPVFRRAERKNVSLLVGVAGGTGSGKTYSAMRLAHGICGDKPFAVIDTEAGRASHYADQFKFDTLELDAPFSPVAYQDAIIAADRAGYPAIVVDSMSHEWAGDGGCLDMQEAELDRMAGDNWGKREACKMAAWIKPKTQHKHMVTRLLQCRAHIILCFRAEPKIEMVKVDGKMQIVPKASLTGLDGWLPITEKMLPFELTCSFLLMADAPGIPRPIKLQEQHRALFPAGLAIDEDAGRRLAVWAAGGSPASAAWSAGDRNWSETHRTAIQTAATLEALKTAFAAAQAEAKRLKDPAALAEFVKVKDARKEVLEREKFVKDMDDSGAG